MCIRDRVRIKDDEAGTFGKRQRIPRTGTVSITPRAATISNRRFQPFDPVVAVDAGNDLSGYICNVAEELAGWIPTRLWRRAERIAVDVCEQTTVRSKPNRVGSDCRWCGDFAPHQH